MLSKRVECRKGPLNANKSIDFAPSNLLIRSFLDQKIKTYYVMEHFVWKFDRKIFKFTSNFQKNDPLLLGIGWK